MMIDEVDVLQKSNISYKRCQALCNIGFYLCNQSDITLYLLTSTKKAIKEIYKCFNAIFKHHAWLNNYSEAGLTFYLKEDIDDTLVKTWIDKAGHEAVFFDLVSCGKYENFEAIIVDYQIEEYQFVGFTDKSEVFKIIDDTIKILEENDDFFNNENESINDIINQYWQNNIDFDYNEYLNNL